MQQDRQNSNEGSPEEALILERAKTYRRSPYYNLIIKNKARVLGELATLKDSPLFQYLRVIRDSACRDLIINDKEGPGEKADLHRGAIKLADELLGMAESIKNAEQVEKNWAKYFDQIDKEIS